MMFGWSKREKNEKSQNKATAELKHLDAKAKGKKLSRLRKRYPNRLMASSFDFADELFDYDLVILYLLLSDDMAVESADVFDNPDPKPEPGPEPKTGQDLVDMVEAAVVSDVVVAAEEVAPEVEETVSEATPKTASFDSPPVESSPSVESSPETTSSNSGSNSGGYSGGGGYDSGSFDSGGGD